MTLDTDRPSYWLDSTPAPAYAPLEQDAEAEVAIVGAGIVGLTAAHLLAKAGRDVLVVDRHQIVHRETGHTTAHLSWVPDATLTRLLDVHGPDKTRRTLEGLRFSIDLIERIQREEAIDCDFARVPGYLYGPRSGDDQYLAKYQAHMERLGFPADSVEPERVPFAAEAALKFPDQGRFHPRKYLLALAERITQAGGRIHQDTEVRDVEAGDSMQTLKLANGRTVRAKSVILASHTPFIDRLRMSTRLYPYRSYVVGARVPKGALEDALYWDTLTPFHYTRIQPLDERHDLVMFGGEDHKTGHASDAERRWDRLEGALRQALTTEFDVTYRWSAQDPQTHDELPFIGVNPGSPERVLMATGFGGQGMTFGTLAGWMLAQRVLGESTEWDELYDPSRVTLDNLKRYAKENVDYPKEMVKGYLTTGRSGPDLPDLAPGQGTVIRQAGKKIAVARDEKGNLHALDAVCKHLGCLVNWNTAEKSWDCPCHGSRYTIEGGLLEGPAPSPLERVSLDELPERATEERRETTR